MSGSLPDTVVMNLLVPFGENDAKMIILTYLDICHLTKKNPCLILFFTTL